MTKNLIKTSKILLTTALLAGAFAFPVVTQADENYPTYVSYSPSQSAFSSNGTNPVLDNSYYQNQNTYYQTNYQNNTPQFNIFTPFSHTQAANRDYYLLDIKNDTKDGNFNDPVNADPGDILTFSVYYHNGVDNTVANNTRVKVTLPSSYGTQLTSTAYLSADNANSISDTGTVNASSASYLQYISGSTRWYPNQTDDRYSAPAYLPYSQSSDGIVNNGINIGNIQGCWEYSGYVNFQVRVVGYIAPVQYQQQQQQQQQVIIKTVTGAGNVAGTAAEASGVSAVAIGAVYFIKRRFDLLTKFKLGAYTLGIRSFGKFRKT